MRFIWFLLFAIPFNLIGQDIHFSQYLFSPINLNPANAGNFDGDYRFNANQRTQWRSVTTPYSTFSLAADANNFLRKKNIGASIGIMNDKAGDSKLNTLQFSFGVSYKIKINSDSTQRIILGVQSGVTQKKINYNGLSFDNQFDGFIYDPQLGVNENFSTNKRTYINANVGSVYIYDMGERKKIEAGISLHNLNKPQQSFYNDKQVKLDVRLTFSATAQFYLNKKWDILPSMQFMDQGPHTEIIAGGMAKYIFNDKAPFNRSVYAGYFGRIKDAGYILLAMDYDQWKVGVSYDINFSKLEQVSRNKGGLEVSVIYILQNLKNKIVMHKLCPDFI